MNMKFIDLHCDTASRIFYEKQHLSRNNFSIDEEKLLKGNAAAQFFAFFIDEKSHDINKEFYKMYDNFIHEIDNTKSISVAGDYKGYKDNISKDKISAFLTIEDGEVLEGNMENLYDVYNKKIRLITLTWNYENSIGYPNCKKDYMNMGLKNFGIDLVGEMNRLGVIIDTSHLSDGGFYDVAKYSRKPFVASHSNSREVMNHPRNLTDDMIKILADKGGVMGLNYCSAFVEKNNITTIEGLINQINHIVKVGGQDVICLGSDFDGIENEVEFKNPSNIDMLLSAIKKNGYSDDFIEKIFYKNAERVIKDVL